MATGRMLNKSISTDAKLAKILASLDGDTRATGIAVWTWTIAHLNCWGVYHGNPHVLLGHVVPMLPWVTVGQIEDCVRAFVAGRMLITWEDREQLWLWYPKFRSNQPFLRTDRESRVGLTFPIPPLREVLKHNIDPIDAGYAEVDLDSKTLEKVYELRCACRSNSRRKKSHGQNQSRELTINDSSATIVDSPLMSNSPTSAMQGSEDQVFQAFESAWPGEVTDSFVRDLVDDFPDIDLVACIHDAKAWEMQHPRRAKKRHTMFLRNWCKTERARIKRAEREDRGAYASQVSADESGEEYEQQVVENMKKRRREAEERTKRLT